MRKIAVADIGGTHARFAMADIDKGRVVSLGPSVILKTAEHGSFELAWQEFGRRSGIELPNEVAIAFAGPVGGTFLKLTNNAWTIPTALIEERLGVVRYTIVNDLGAVSHAVASLGDEHFRHLCGPDRPLPGNGVISIVGPGTGLGVAALVRNPGGHHVIETEAGHIGFAPLDDHEDKLLAQMRETFGRVSVERVASGPGLWNLYLALGILERRSLALRDERHLWESALEGSDELASRALERFCLVLGAFAGDMALAHGAKAVVIAGGVGLRLAGHLPRSGFGERFVAKGRFERHMRDMSVKLVTFPEPGLFGAAAAFAREHG